MTTENPVPDGADGATREQEIFHELSQWDKYAHYPKMKLGLLCCEVERDALWVHRSASMPEWLAEAAPRGRSTCYEAWKEVKELSDVPAVALASVRNENIHTMKQLSTAVRNDEAVIGLAQTASSEALIAHVHAHYPEQHIPKERKPVKVMCDDPESFYALLDEGIERGLALDRGGMLEYLANETRLVWKLEDMLAVNDLGKPLTEVHQ